MSWLTKHLNTETLYWLPPKRDGEGGYKWGFPCVILGRWEYSRRVVYDSKGSEIFSNINVWVKDPLQVGGYLFEGGLFSLGTATLAQYTPDDINAEYTQENALQIITLDKMYSLGNSKQTYYKAVLQKHGLSKRG